MAKLLPKKLAILLMVSILVFLYLYYYNNRLDPKALPLTRSRLKSGKDGQQEGGDANEVLAPPGIGKGVRWDTCPDVRHKAADIETSNVFPGLDLQPPWMERREYWGNEMEDRYVKRKSMWPALPLRVIVMPHSHNDPGWLKTYEGYFATATRGIITNMVNKLTQHRNMTFIWTEVSFLSRWWGVADGEMKDKMRRLIDEKRLEIATGGWVMTDEANVDLFSMIDQLVEGHKWLRENLNVVPESSWSVDPFGHGAAFPHLLKQSGVDNMVIMRIHYAWKEWFARHQLGDFLWKQPWEEDGSTAPLCHNFPYDIYSIKHSCGPRPQTCLGFDFRHVDGEYNEFSIHYTPINQYNVQSRAELLLEQYGRTGSLYPHNVVLVPLGDDFRYNKDVEFDQQYENYMQLMKHINAGDYNAHVTFGTLTDYFTEVRHRMKNFRTLSGDFFVYSDIFSEGRPAYWSGYYTTRPFVKRLSRVLATNLRTAEILYSLSLGRKAGHAKEMEQMFSFLTEARENLGLFQHHDAITGTSRAYVMQDYGIKLFDGLGKVREVQAVASQNLLNVLHAVRHLDLLGEDWTRLPSKATLDLIGGAVHNLVIFNSLGQAAQETASIRTNSASACVEDTNGETVDVQISPAYDTVKNKLDLELFDVTFGVELKPLGFSVYRLKFCDRSSDELSRRKTKIFCLSCPQSETPAYKLGHVPEGAVQIENNLYRLLFDPISKLLRNATNKLNGVSMPLDLEFSAYNSAPFRSGAYLFQTDPAKDVESEVFSERDIKSIVIISGPVFSQLTVVWEIKGTSHQNPSPSTFLHSVKLYHLTGPLSEAVHIENLFDFGPSPNMKDLEVLMRFRSGVRNGNPPTMFSDQSGLGMQKRVWVPAAGLEGNYFPITSSAYIEDGSNRLTLLVDHAAGAAAVKEGSLEVMVDRRTMYDDARGMGEGVVDSVSTLHRYTLLLEPLQPDSPSRDNPLPSLSFLATVLSRHLEHTPTMLHVGGKDAEAMQPLDLLASPLPCDFHLLNLRSWSDRREGVDGVDSHALLTLQRHAPDCSWASLTMAECRRPQSKSGIKFNGMETQFSPTTLTANHLATKAGKDAFDLAPMELAAYNVTFSS